MGRTCALANALAKGLRQPMERQTFGEGRGSTRVAKWPAKARRRQGLRRNQACTKRLTRKLNFFFRRVDRTHALRSELWCGEKRAILISSSLNQQVVKGIGGKLGQPFRMQRLWQGTSYRAGLRALL